jgi:hypothetical protein
MKYSYFIKAKAKRDTGIARKRARKLKEVK